MAKNTIRVVDVVIVNFDEVKHYDDRGIYNHFAMTCRLFKKPLLPKSTRFNAYRVSRAERAVTVHLLLDTKETARVSFVALPDFSQINT